MYWNDLGEEYDRLYAGRWSKLEDEFVRGKLEQFGVSGYVLDVGCGTGLGKSLLNGDVSHLSYHGCDPGQKLLDIASRKFTYAIWHNCKAEEIEEHYPANYFDWIISLNGAVAHFNMMQFISNAHKVLKPGGKIFLMTYNQYALRRGWMTSQWGDYPGGVDCKVIYYSKQRLSRMCSVHFTEMSCFTAFSLGRLAEHPRLWRLSQALDKYDRGHMVFYVGGSF